jgi:hypothetical protein
MRPSGLSRFHTRLFLLVSELELCGYVRWNEKDGVGANVLPSTLSQNRLNGKRYWTPSKLCYKEKRHGD